MTDRALVYYEICFECVDDEIWPTEHWYTMGYDSKAWTTKYGRLGIGSLYYKICFESADYER